MEQQPAQSSQPPVSDSKYKMLSIVLGVAFLLLLVGIGSYILGTKNQSKNDIVMTLTATLSPTPDSIVTSTPSIISPTQTKSVNNDMAQYNGRSSYAQDETKGNFTLMYPTQNCHKIANNINCKYDFTEYSFTLIPQAGGHGANVVKDEKITLNGVEWDKKLLADDKNVVQGASYSTTKDNITHLMEVQYELYIPGLETEVESIISTFQIR